MTPTELQQRIDQVWARRPPSQIGEAPQIAIDWVEYFKRFCEKHGRFPLMYQGRLLFPDGWTYSATDHAGPEWPPPEKPEECLKLRRVYWRLRKSAVRRELVLAMERLSAAQTLIASRSAMPAQRVVYFDPETSRSRTQVGDLDVAALEQRVEWLRQDLESCELNIIEPGADRRIQ